MGMIIMTHQIDDLGRAVEIYQHWTQTYPQHVYSFRFSASDGTWQIVRASRKKVKDEDNK